MGQGSNTLGTMHAAPLSPERSTQVKAESSKVWKFIMEREIEAPARFQAIQTHRATMAIIRQQARLGCSPLCSAVLPFSASRPSRPTAPPWPSAASRRA